MWLEVHQATGLRLQEAADPLSGILSTIPALYLQAMHSTVGGDRATGKDNLDAMSIVNTIPERVGKLHQSNCDATTRRLYFQLNLPQSNCINLSEVESAVRSLAFPICLLFSS